jgi:hypothetical protein
MPLEGAKNRTDQPSFFSLRIFRFEIPSARYASPIRIGSKLPAVFYGVGIKRLIGNKIKYVEVKFVAVGTRCAKRAVCGVRTEKGKTILEDFEKQRKTF